MLRIKKLLTYGIPAIALVFLLVYYVVMPGFDIDESPVVTQAAYYAVAGRAGFIDLSIKSDFMKKTHRATRVRKSDERTPYTFVYKKEHVGILDKDSRRCQACHGSMRQASGGKPLYPIHDSMLSVEVLAFHCTDCHKTVDLGRRVATGVTIRVDRTLCTRCHEGDKNTEPLGLGKSASGSRDAIASRYLVSNHGIDKQTGAQWIKRHALVAKSIGVRQCYRCHAKKSELDFCDDCHNRPKL